MALSSQSGPDCMVGLRPRTLQGTPMYPPTLAIIRPRPVGFPSGQRGRAVNPLAQPSKVRILLPPLPSDSVGGGHVRPQRETLLLTPDIGGRGRTAQTRPAGRGPRRFREFRRTALRA